MAEEKKRKGFFGSLKMPISFKRRRGSEGENNEEFKKQKRKPKLKSCPNIANTASVFGDIQKPLLDTSAMGFLSLLDDSERQVFVSKMECNRRDYERKVPPPTLITELVTLTTIFPTLPEQELRFLIPQFQGNCRAIYDHLNDADFPFDPEIEHNPDVFINSADIHYQTVYYHGVAPQKDVLAEMFEEKEVGVFITFFRAMDVDVFQYFLCYKNILDKIIEKPIQGPVVPEGLKSMLDLTAPIASEQEELSIPCLNNLFN